MENRLSTMVLEAVVGPDGHIWYVSFVYLGSMNDLNILGRSPLMGAILDSMLKCDRYSINGNEYDEYYLLADSIYPSWSCFVKTFNQPNTAKKKHFAKVQEAKRKQVE